MYRDAYEYNLLQLPITFDPPPHTTTLYGALSGKVEVHFYDLINPIEGIDNDFGLFYIRRQSFCFHACFIRNNLESKK
jgi:hypothetical protein